MENDSMSSRRIDNQTLAFLYYESATLTIKYVETYLLNANTEIDEKIKTKDRKKIDDINLVIKSFLDIKPLEIDDEILWQGKLCSLISLVFNLSSHKEVSERLIYLFFEISQIRFKFLYKTNFWYELLLLVQVQMVIELNGIVKRPVPMITKAVFNEYQNHELFTLIPIQKLKYYSSKKKEVLEELEHSEMNDIVNKYTYTQFLEKMVFFFKYLLNDIPTPSLILNKPEIEL